MGVVDDVYTYLEAQSITGGATGYQAVRRRVIDPPDKIVVLTEDGGQAPEIGTDEGIGDAAYRDAGVQVRVRADAWNGDASQAKAQEVYDALHGLLGATVGATTYQRIAAMTPEPVFIGFDDKGRPEHTIAFRMATPQGAPS